MVEEITRTVTEAMYRFTSKIKTRTLPHHKMDDKMKTKLLKAGRIKILLANGINIRKNKRN